MSKKYMTAKQLGISSDEYKALKQLVTLLPTIELAPDNPTLEVITDTRVATPKKQLFNMGYGCVRTACGTVACVGGWVATLMGIEYVDERDDYVYNIDDDSLLHNLYFPDIWCSWEGITPEMAVEAIKNFLTDGDADWEALFDDYKEHPDAKELQLLKELMTEDA